jgi:hypothetical protein
MGSTPTATVTPDGDTANTPEPTDNNLTPDTTGVKSHAASRKTARPKQSVTKKAGKKKAAPRKAATRKAATRKAATRKAATRKAATRKAATRKAAKDHQQQDGGKEDCQQEGYACRQSYVAFTQAPRPCRVWCGDARARCIGRCRFDLTLCRHCP